MTIPSTTSRNNYTGNGSASNFTYNFKIFDEDDLTVVVTKTSTSVETTLAINTDYTVAGVGDTSGSITLVNSSQAWLTAGNLSTGYTISIRRVVDIIQSVDIRNQGQFFAETHEDKFDYLTMIDLQQQDELDRSIKAPEGETLAGSMALPEVADRAGNFLAFDSNGLPIASSGGISSSIPVSAFMETVLDDTSAAVARATLDVSQAINSLAAETAPASGDLVAIRDVSEPADNKMTLANLMSVVSVLTQDTSPALNDSILTYDTSAAAAKRVLISDLKESAFRAVTTTDTATTIDEVLSLSGASFTQNLYTAVGNGGKRLRLIHAGTSITQVYTIDPNAAETVGGSATTTLNTNGEILDLLSDNANWIILSRYIPCVWTSYAGVVGATTTPPTFGTTVRNQWFWRRTGDSIELMVNKAHSTAGTAGSGTYLFPLPSGITVDTSKNSAAFIDGQGLVGPVTFNGGANVYTGVALIKDTTNLYLELGDTAAATVAMTSAAYAASAATWRVSFQAKVPITGWNG